MLILSIFTLGSSFNEHCFIETFLFFCANFTLGSKNIHEEQGDILYDLMVCMPWLLSTTREMVFIHFFC